jgi:hypothetical protein
MPHIDTPQSRCVAGVARRDVTPPVGIYHRTWGAATHDRATGVHRPLTATALIFQARNGRQSVDHEQVIIAVDLCQLGACEMQALLESISRRGGVQPEQLMVAFSHTHSTGLMGLDRVGLPGGDLIPAFLNELAARIGDAVIEARQKARPAAIVYGSGRCTMAAQRDFRDETSGQYVCGFNPDGVADDTVLTARITDETGAFLATVVNYACHPTTLSWQNTLLSPDFPGAMREVIERATGGPCLFLQGASGDIGPREGYVGDPEIADGNGRQLGYAALAALEALPPAGTRFVYTGPVISGATLGTWAHQPVDEKARDRYARWQLRRWTLELPYRADIPTAEGARAERDRWQAEERTAHAAGDALKARDCRAMAERMTRWLGRLPHLPPGSAFPLPIVLWRMGDAIWLAVESEHYNLLQRSLRDRFPDTPIIVMTLANGSRATYLPTLDTYGKRIYQESIAVLAPGSLERLIEALAEEIQGSGVVG